MFDESISKKDKRNEILSYHIKVLCVEIILSTQKEYRDSVTKNIVMIVLSIKNYNYSSLKCIRSIDYARFMN